MHMKGWRKEEQVVDTERRGESLQTCFFTYFNLQNQTVWQHLFIQNKLVQNDVPSITNGSYIPVVTVYKIYINQLTVIHGIHYISFTLDH